MNNATIYAWEKTEKISSFESGDLICLCEYHADVYHQSKSIEQTDAKCLICTQNQRISENMGGTR